MGTVEFKFVDCPYCGETFETSIDGSNGEQDYVEDCYVCCRPIVFAITIVDEELFVSVRHEDEC
ncbi:hypothetical protein BCU70_16560 [Vibrio sp. 10N.286.49.C2]|uniref:CPXCG motif-containing cysteine-rich protein n=1 Tax=unclassified Vibrio TaxID=2614977 RepID=UPI000C836687|nr:MULTISPECIES: CPXCG motif-containing cysteine-rich protein [unclassified Vibrio]PMH37247.1 hypothetical protein BCU70_16560 [Vibrio sp. 10N.286.49.C2]PMH57392.1 hypothetical protein BCU66_05200 [Vibrio sp. 10N.286.49.B1]PMH82151.1 hypothetical protein BCU58_19080 [Vibrio sp. 10N.286.48.B7]